MAIKSCRECGADVSDGARNCPYCGIKDPIKRMSFFIKLLIFFAIIFMLATADNMQRDIEKQRISKEENAKEQARIAALTPEQRDAEEKKKKAELAAKETEKKKQEEREKDFNRRLAFARVITDKYKESLKNPSSFQIVSAFLVKDGTICCRYRATNSFNAIVLEAFVFTPDGKYSSSADEDKLISLWNKRCANIKGTDVTDEFQ
ncbi:MAG: zinc ribbon domain-containing protein [Magnetococcales bacterium]|nr:zinc ribbon domain-containing protein [Magnetococcales bacterium]